jgi:hypothetical protein
MLVTPAVRKRLVPGAWIVFPRPSAREPGVSSRARRTTFNPRFLMSKRVKVYVVGLVCFLSGLLLAPHLPFAQAQENKAKAPLFLYGMNLRSRKATEPDFNENTKKWGIEVFKDDNNGNTIYISETGSIAVVK